MLSRLRNPQSTLSPAALSRRGRPDEIPDPPAGWATGPPDFVGIGAQRSGTSWWYSGIEEHPGIATIPGREKELHYFTRFWQGELPDGWIERYHRLFPRPEGAIAGEWTPRYMRDFWTPMLLREAAPDAKLLVILRDPIERFRSGLERRARLSPGGGPLDLVHASDQVYRSMYAAQLRRVLDHFPREQLLVLQFERCRDEPMEMLAVTWRFLGLEPLGELPSSIREPGRQRDKSEMPESWRRELVARLADDVEDLAELCRDEIELERWPNFRHLDTSPN